MRNPIALILTDLDGTLVQTRAANYHAYREVLAEHGVVLTEEHYNRCFGLRLEEFRYAHPKSSASDLSASGQEDEYANSCCFDGAEEEHHERVTAYRGSRSV